MSRFELIGLYFVLNSNYSSLSDKGDQCWHQILYFCQLDMHLYTPGKRESQLRDWPFAISVGPFLDYWLMYSTHPTVDGVIYGQVGLSCKREQAKQASKQHFSMVSALTPGSTLLPWSPAWLPFMMETLTCRLKWTLSSPSWFWSMFDHRNRKQAETAARPQTWFLMFTIVPR